MKPKKTVCDMDPMSMISSFAVRVYMYVKAGINWRHMVEDYETEKTGHVAQKYQFRIFPLDFVSVRRSQFAGDVTNPGSPGDYARTVIKVKDIYPFILNAHSSAVFVRSFRKLDASAFDGLLLNVTGYCLGSYLQGFSDRYHKFDPNKYYPINANHSAFDRPGTPGILDFSLNNDRTGNRRVHTLTEKGKAYALAPNVKPNLITEMQVMVKGKNYIYVAILLLIILSIALNKKTKSKTL